MDWYTWERPRMLPTLLWALIGSGIVVAAAATLGRAALNLRAALTDKPDIGIYILLPDEGISSTTLLRETDDQRDYLAETRDGPKLIILRKKDGKWEVAEMERLRE